MAEELTEFEATLRQFQDDVRAYQTYLDMHEKQEAIDNAKRAMDRGFWGLVEAWESQVKLTAQYRDSMNTTLDRMKAHAEACEKEKGPSNA